MAKNQEPISTQQSPFRKFDEWLFKQVDVMNASAPFQKFSFYFSSLKEMEQIIIKGIITALVFALPLAPTSYLLYQNYQNHKQTKNLKIVQESFDDYKFEKQQLSSQHMSMAKEKIETQENFQTLLDRMRQMYQIQGTISVTSFDIQGTFIEEVNSKIQIRGFSIDHFSQIIEFLVQKTKGKLKSLDIYRNQGDQKLQGEMEFTFFHRTSDQREEKIQDPGFGLDQGMIPGQGGL